MGSFGFGYANIRKRRRRPKVPFLLLLGITTKIGLEEKERGKYFE